MISIQQLLHVLNALALLCPSLIPGPFHDEECKLVRLRSLLELEMRRCSPAGALLIAATLREQRGLRQHRPRGAQDGCAQSAEMKIHDVS